MSEIPEHKRLKSLAKQILLENGFKENEIFLEYTVAEAGSPIKLTARKGSIADVVGIKDNFRAVIECGNTPSERLAQFKLFFDEIYYLPYVKTIHEVTDLPDLRSQIGSLKEENRRLTLYNQELSEKLKQLDNRIREVLSNT